MYISISFSIYLLNYTSLIIQNFIYIIIIFTASNLELSLHKISREYI
jgi:hypothetical protein